MRKKSVIVIGGGVGGLAAAIVLARRGARVTLLESAPHLGGKMAQEWVDGVAFDTGPSLLTLPTVLEMLFDLAGSAVSEHLVLRAPSRAFRYVYPDGVALDVHHDFTDTCEHIRDALGAVAANEFRQFLGYARQIWEVAAPAFVFADAPSLGNLLTRDLGLLPKLPKIDGTSRMWSAIQKRVRDPHLRDLLARYATYNGSDVRCAPATLNCIAWVELGMGGFGVLGGMYAVTQALERLCVALGVEVCLGTRAVRIEASSGRPCAVHTASKRLPADAVIVNADVAHLFQDLLPVAMQTREPPKPSMSAWTAVVKGQRSADRAPHTVLFPDHYIREFEDLFDHRRAPLTPTIYVCDQFLAHGREGWGSDVALFVMVNAPAVDPARAKPQWDAMRAQVLTRLRQARVIGEQDDVVWERSPEGLSMRFPGSLGSIYGAASNSVFSAFYRPSNRLKQLPGVYLASGSAHPGGGVPMCLLSGMLAARACLQDITPDLAHIPGLR